MALKHRGVKIVPVKITRFEVRTVDGHKLKTFSSTASAKAWIDGYMQAYAALTPKAPPAGTRTAKEATNGATVRVPRKRKKVEEEAAQA